MVKQKYGKKEVNSFLSHAKDYQSYIVFYLAIHTGMRMGEILGLHWSDINFNNNVISVTESLDRITKKRGSLKTESSKRLISLTDSQMNVLKEHKQFQDPEFEIVCASEVGVYLNSSNIRRAMKSICKKANVK